MTTPQEDAEVREFAHRVMNADTPYDAMQFIKARDAQNGMLAQLEAVPQGLLSAHRYNTDDEAKIHLWDGNGHSYDIAATITQSPKQ